jgi:menaquinol-cytochrome c reductase cytochrome b/c subunit
MKLISLALTCVAIALVAIACTETATPTNTSSSRPAGSPAAAASPAASVDQFATARANYKKNCEACHGPEATGGLVKVDKKQIKVPSLKADHAIKHTDEQLTKMITNGEEEMPSFKDKMSAAEISEMVRFIRKEFQGK